MTKHVVTHDLFDAETYGEARESFPRLNDSLTAREADLVTAPPLFQDAFLSFYQRQPNTVDRDALDAPYQPNRDIMTELMQTREWAEIRNAGTVGDDLTSAIATASVMDRVVKAIPSDRLRDMNDLATLTEQAEKLLRDADTLDDLAGEYNAPEMKDKADEARLESEVTTQLADEAGRRLQDGAEDVADAVRRAARVAMTEAKAEVEALQAALEAFGGSPGKGAGDGGGQTSAKDKLAVARRLRDNPKLQQLAIMVGRYVRIALAVQRERVVDEPAEISSVKTGNDLAHVLPSEMALLGDEATEDIFYYRFAEAKLMQYEVSSNEKLGRGPLIVVTDESSSMRTPLGNATRDLWAKAVALALLSVARKQRRDFAWLHFGSHSEYKHDAFKCGQATPSQAIAAADHFFNGGTSYARWMEASMEMVSSSKHDRADVVLLSDGEADVTALETRWAALRKSRQMRCYAVLIGDELSAGRTLAKIADKVFTVADLAGEGDVLRSVFSV